VPPHRRALYELKYPSTAATRQGSRYIRSGEAGGRRSDEAEKARCARLSASVRGIVGTFVGREENLQKMAEKSLVLAEREGFEPPIRLPVCRISSAVLSTAQPPLRKA
jgi:hypothetical protein